MKKLMAYKKYIFSQRMQSIGIHIRQPREDQCTVAFAETFGKFPAHSV